MGAPSRKAPLHGAGGAASAGQGRPQRRIVASLPALCPAPSRCQTSLPHPCPPPPLLTVPTKVQPHHARGVRSRVHKVQCGVLVRREALQPQALHAPGARPGAHHLRRVWRGCGEAALSVWLEGGHCCERRATARRPQHAPNQALAGPPHLLHLGPAPLPPNALLWGRPQRHQLAASLPAHSNTWHDSWHARSALLSWRLPPTRLR